MMKTANTYTYLIAIYVIPILRLQYLYADVSAENMKTGPHFWDERVLDLMRSAMG